MTVPTTTPSDRVFWEALHRLHGHRCPMSILGARLGLSARAALGELPETVHFSGRYLHRTCALDGIQFATSCTLGNNNLAVEPVGEHRLTLGVQETGQEVDAWLTETALEIGRGYGQLRQRLHDVSEDSAEAQSLRQEMEGILKQLESADDATLVRTGGAGQSGPR